MSTSACCATPGTVLDGITVCPQPCEDPLPTCSDVISMCIQAILNLREERGSSALAIYENILLYCSSVTQESIDLALASAARRGILRRIIYPEVTSTPTYMVNALMVSANWQNRLYNRSICGNGSQSFWACS